MARGLKKVTVYPIQKHPLIHRTYKNISVPQNYLIYAPKIKYPSPVASSVYKTNRTRQHKYGPRPFSEARILLFTGAYMRHSASIRFGLMVGNGNRIFYYMHHRWCTVAIYEISAIHKDIHSEYWRHKILPKYCPCKRLWQQWTRIHFHFHFFF